MQNFVAYLLQLQDITINKRIFIKYASRLHTPSL